MTTSTTARAWEALRSLDKFKQTGPAQYEACCPSHDDRKPSLSIGIDAEGVIGLTCHSPCTSEDVVKALGCVWADLYPPKADGASAKGNTAKRIVATYDYRDETGALLYQAVRYVPKDFAQRRPDGHGGWIWKLGDVRRVPYRLRELLADTSGDLWIFEGEKDADRAATLGLNATTTAQGASSFGRTAEAMRAVATGKRVFLVPDADDGGDGYARTALAALRSVATSVRSIYLPRLTQRADHGEDFSNWLDEHDGTLKELRALAARPDTENTNGTGQEQKSNASEKWQPNVQSMRDLMDKELPAVKWSVHDLFPEGVTLLAAKAKKGKSTLMLHVGSSVSGGTMALGHFATEQSEVLFVFLEENERRLQKRMRQMMQGTRVPAGLHVVYEWPLLDHGGLEALDTYLEAHPGIGMVVIDTLEHVRAKRRIANGLYGDDYAAVRGLQQLAGKRQVAIVAITHLRKAPADDPFDEINASMGLLSGVDNAVVMRPAQGVMELHRRGRDYEDDTVLALKGDTKTLLWTVAGEAEEVTRSAARKEIIAALKADAKRKKAAKKPEDGMLPKAIALALGKNEVTTRRLLQKLLDEKTPAIRVDGEGHYHAVTEQTAPPPSPPTPDPPFTPEHGGVNGPQPGLGQASATMRSQRSQRSQGPIDALFPASDSFPSEQGVNSVNGVNGRSHDAPQTGADATFTPGTTVHSVHDYHPEWEPRYLELRKQGVPEREATYQAMHELEETT